MKRSGKEISNTVQKYDIDDNTDFIKIIEKVTFGQVSRLYLRDFATDPQKLMQSIKTLLEVLCRKVRIFCERSGIKEEEEKNSCE
jgi:hypothetical protein